MAQAALPMMVLSQLMGGIQQHDQLKAGALTDEENARRAELGGAFQEQALRDRGRAVSGEAIAALAGNGVSVAPGQSSGDLLFQSNLAMETDALAARYNAGSEAASLRTSAGQKRAAAKWAVIGGAMRAGAAALSGSDQLDTGGGGMASLEARFPGGQKLPIPAHLNAPIYRGGEFNKGFAEADPFFGNLSPRPRDPMAGW